MAKPLKYYSKLDKRLVDKAVPYHLVNIFVDRGIVFYNLRFWGKYKRRWFYTVQSRDQVEMMFDEEP